MLHHVTHLNHTEEDSAEQNVAAASRVITEHLRKRARRDAAQEVKAFVYSLCTSIRLCRQVDVLMSSFDNASIA